MGLNTMHSLSLRDDIWQSVANAVHAETARMQHQHAIGIQSYRRALRFVATVMHDASVRHLEDTYLLSFDTYTWQAIQNAIAPELSMLAGRTHPADRVYADNLRHADAVIRARIVPGVSA